MSHLSQAIISIAPDVVFQVLTGEAVLLNMKTEHYYMLDDVGTRMWQVLSESGNIETAIGQLLQEYEVEEAELRQDLETLISELAEANLIVINID